VIDNLKKGSGDNALAYREASLSEREKILSEREALLARREREHADRVASWADRWERECSAANTPTIIQQTVAGGATKYSKSDVEPLLSQARQVMSKRGLLAADLPGQAQGLEKDATKAMSKGDYGSARFAASQLLGTVKAVKVDRDFLRSKWSRLHAAMQNQKLSPEPEQLLLQAGKLMTDGSYDNANRQPGIERWLSRGGDLMIRHSADDSRIRARWDEVAGLSQYEVTSYRASSLTRSMPQTTEADHGASRRTRGSHPMVVWSLEVEKRRGKRIAIVALARKIASILYTLMRDGSRYDPTRGSAMLVC
jgi:hypothetical protein